MRDAATFAELTRDSPLPVVVGFWRSWCDPSRVVASELKKIAASRKGLVVVVTVDTEALPAVASFYDVSAIPTVIRFDRGTETKRTSGPQLAASLAESLGLGRHAA